VRNAETFSTGCAWNWFGTPTLGREHAKHFGVVCFSFLIILFRLKLGNVRLRDYEAVGGFFDASQERADNTSFEGYETNYYVLEHWLTAEAFRAGGRLWDIHGQRCPERARR